MCVAMAFSNISNGSQNCVALAGHYPGGPIVPSIDSGSRFSFSACGSFIGATGVNSLAISKATLGVTSTNCVAISGSSIGDGCVDSIGLAASTVGKSCHEVFAACIGSIGDYCANCVALGAYSGMDAYTSTCFAVCDGYISSAASPNGTVKCAALISSTIDSYCSNSFSACSSSVHGSSGGPSTKCLSMCSSSVGSGSHDSVALANSQVQNVLFGGLTACVAIAASTVGGDTSNCTAIAGSTVVSFGSANTALGNSSIGVVTGGLVATTCSFASGQATIGNGCTSCFSAGHQASVADSIESGIAMGTLAQSTGSMGMAFGKNASASAYTVSFGGGTSASDAIDTFRILGYNGGAIITLQAFDNPAANDVGLIITYNTGASVVNRQVLAAVAPPAGSLLLYLTP